MKKILTIAVIAACMAANVNGQRPAEISCRNCSGDDTEFFVDGFVYVINDREKNTVSFDGVCRELTPALNIAIPPKVIHPCTLVEYTVNRIGYSHHPLYGCSSFMIVSIPLGVTEIGARAFQNCKMLSEVTFNGGFMKSIGFEAFSGCTSLISIMSPDLIFGMIRSIPMGITEIQSHTFAGCSSLESLMIPSTVSTIGQYAFANCSSLRHMHLHPDVKTINGMAFQNCSSLSLVSTAATGIGSSAFQGCPLKEFWLGYPANIFSSYKIINDDYARQCELRPLCSITEDDLLANGWICNPNNTRFCSPFILGKCMKNWTFVSRMFGDMLVDAVPGVGIAYWAAQEVDILSVKSMKSEIGLPEGFMPIAIDTLDAEGNFHFENLPEGRYIIGVGMEGYESTPSAVIELTGDESDEISGINFVVDHEALTIRPYVAVGGVSIGKPALSLVVGASETLTATVTPTNATEPAVTWSSNNPAAATVNETTGLVTAVAPGEAVITATAGDHTATCTVTVESESITAAPELYAPDMKAYPNPFTGTVRLTGAEGCTLRVINTAGTTVHTQNIENPDETVRLEHLSAGVYFFHIEKNGRVKTMKVVKQ